MDKKIKGVIITNTNNELTEEEILISIIKETKIDNILDLNITGDYFKCYNISGEYLLDIKKNDDELFSILVIVNESNISNKRINYDLLFSLIIFILIITTVVVLIVQKIIFYKKSKRFLK